MSQGFAMIYAPILEVSIDTAVVLASVDELEYLRSLKLLKNAAHFFNLKTLSSTLKRNATTARVSL